MSKNIFRDLLKPQTKLSRNGFDRSYLNNFTGKIGELLPVMAIETIPNSHYEIKVSDLMRTLPMQSASFIRASQHFEFYFVPFKLLWRRWDDFYTTRSMPLSTQQSMAIPQAAPSASLGDILAQIRDSKTSEVGFNNFGDIGEFIGAGASKIANLLGYVGDKPFDPSDDLPDYLYELKPNLFRAAAYQKICFDYYRQPFYDLPYEGIQYTLNLDDSDTNTGEVDYFFTSDSVQFNRLAKLFQLHYRQWKKDLFTGVLPDTQFGAVSIVNTGTTDVVKNIELAVDAALDTNHVETYGRGTSLARTATGQLPTPPVSVDVDGNIVDNSSSQVELGNLLDDNQAYIKTTGALSDSSVSGTASGSVDFGRLGGSFSVLDLVKAQAIQRWRETTLRSGFRATDQYRGHFGVTPVFTEKDKSVFIDAVSSPLQVNTVVNNTAPQGDGAPALGDLAANGTAVLGADKVIKFDAKDFGILMCIHSVLPEATYNHFGLDLMNQKILKDDFFVPEYENVSLKSVPMSAFRLGSSVTVNGFAANYFEYKVGIDYQSAEFFDGGESVETGYQQPAGAFPDWSPARHISLDWSQSGVVSPRLFARDLYVSPAYYRNIFSRLPYEVDPENQYSIQETIGDSKFDSFIHTCYFDVKCIQPMSVLGMPQY